MRVKHTFRLPPALSARLADYALRKRLSQAVVVEAALTSFLSPDGMDRLEATLARRLDRQVRQLDRLETHIQIANEALAMFVRFWLIATPPLPDTAETAAQTSGRERYKRFLETLGRRMETGQSLARELSLDVSARRERPTGDDE
ncbi:MAG TPA: CopG family transcriptional regulator [Stellaceae bacterium]|nr:CopG family transcriptional regulator [Stellaceae bacterium]